MLFAFRIGMWDAIFVEKMSQYFHEAIGEAASGKESCLLRGLSPKQRKSLADAGRDQRKLDRQVATLRTTVIVIEMKDEWIETEIGGWPGDERIHIPKSSIPPAILELLAPEVQFTARASLYVEKADQVVVRHFEPPLPPLADE
jgi:hypothetical protein